jgi:hypothetical protein
MNDKGMNLTVVNVLDCVPGNADQQHTGPPIGIVTVERCGEIESMLLTMRDVGRLAVDLLGILRFHGSTVADAIYERHFGDGWSSLLPPSGDENHAAPRAVTPPEATLTTQREPCFNPTLPDPEANDSCGLPPLGLKVWVRLKKERPMGFEVFGGFGDGVDIILLHRFFHDGNLKNPIDSQMIVQKGKRLIRTFRTNEWLGKANWKHFALIPDGGTFRIRGKRWKKLTLKELRALLGRRCIFQVVIG